MGAFGYQLFQSDHDFDIQEMFWDDLNCRKLTADAKAAAKAEGKCEEEVNRIALMFDGRGCSDVPFMRQHLDSGVLEKMIKHREAEMLATPTKAPQLGEKDPCYVYVLLGACAMTMGCNLPEPYIAMLKKVYNQGGLMPNAQAQMKKALFGPDGYQNGVPYDFKSLTFEEQAEANGKIPNRKPNFLGVYGMNVLEPGGFFNTGMTTCETSDIIKELRRKYKNPDVCAECDAQQGEGGKQLLQCAKCKDRRYCSVECQKKHWKIHKKLCQPERLGLLST